MQPAPLAPAGHREVRQPGTPLAAIDAELLQPLLEVVGKLRRIASLILEDEHSDASRLAVANGREADLPRSGCGLPQRAADRLELAARPMAEEGERDMQVPTRDDSDVPQLLALPALDLVEHVVRDTQSEEDPQPFIAGHATARSHAASSRLPARS